VSRVKFPVRAEWRVPIAFVVLWVLPPLVAVIHPAWFWGARTHGHAAEAVTAIWLLIVLVGAQALLQRSRIAWWILVALYLAGVAQWVYYVGRHGLGWAWTLRGVLTLVSFALLVSAPMRRFVRLRGRLAP